MHIYIKQTITFEVFDEKIKGSTLTEKEVTYLKNVLYSIVFHKILDLTLSSLPSQKHKEFILKSIEKEPEIAKMEKFLEKYIKDHKKQFKKVSAESELEVLELMLN